MIEKLLEITKNHMLDQNFDCIAVGVIDFKKSSFETFQMTTNEFFEDEVIFFDLASLTKPLTFGFSFLKNEEKFNDDIRLLIEHRSGLPRWGRLSHSSWKEQIQSYTIKESETLYSDFGALRAQIEMEKILGTTLYEDVSELLDEEVKHWLDLSGELTPITGYRNRAKIVGTVNDDNAFVIREKVAHAGLFGSIKGVCQTLLNADKELNLLGSIGVKHSHRYYKGWDTVENLENTLAGKGCSENTFGHLGFTGTSIWIDPKKAIGHVILTNETKGFWYDRPRLIALRKALGAQIFS